MTLLQQVIDFVSFEALRGSIWGRRFLVALLFASSGLHVYDVAMLVGEHVCTKGPILVPWMVPIWVAWLLAVQAYLGWIIGRLEER